MNVQPSSFIPAHTHAFLAGILVTMLLVGSAVFGLSNTRAQQATPSPVAETQSTLRVIHAVPSGPSVDVLVDGEPAAPNLAFGSISEYVPISPGAHQVQVIETGQDASSALATFEVETRSGEAYIVTAIGTAAAIKAKINEVNLDAIDQGKARVRLINAASDVDIASLGITGEEDGLTDSVDYGGDTSYETVDVSTYDLEVRGDDDQVLLTAPGMTFEDGQVYDLVLVGQQSVQSLQLITAITSVSPSCSTLLQVGNEGDACVRFVNAAEDLEAIDIYLGDAVVAEGLEFANMSGYVNVAPVEDVEIRVTSAGTPPDPDTESNGTQTFDGGQAYLGIIAGLNGDDDSGTAPVATDVAGAATGGGTDGIQLLMLQVDLTPLPEGQARLRVINAAGDLGNIDVAVAGGDALFPSVGSGEATEYSIVNAAPFTMQLRPPGEDVVILEFDLTIEPATTNDIIIIGRVEDQSLELLTLTSPTETRKGEAATPVATPVAAGFPNSSPSPTPSS